MRTSPLRAAACHTLLGQLLLVPQLFGQGSTPRCSDHYDQEVVGHDAQAVSNSAIANLTAAIDVVKLERVLVPASAGGQPRYDYWVTLRNRSAKDAIGYTFAQGFLDPSPTPSNYFREIICVGGFESTLHWRVPAAESSDPVATLVSVVFADGSADGNVGKAEGMKYGFLGYSIIHEEIEKILGATQSPSAKTRSADVGAAQLRIQALSEDPFTLEHSLSATTYSRYRLLLDNMRKRTRRDPLTNARWLGMRSGMIDAKRQAVRELEKFRESPPSDGFSRVLDVSRSLLPPPGVITSILETVQ